jgi:predicted TIM-barrel fold metal-dependent hydrolase
MSAKISRRDLLVSLAATAALVSTRTLTAAVSDPPRIDTHVHCFAGRSDKQFPYHARAPYQPDDLAMPEHLLTCMDEAGVAGAVIVHPEPYQDDHRYLEHCLAVGKGRLKGTLLLFCDRPGSLAQLPDLAKRLPLVALRVHAYAPDRLPPFGKPELRSLWKAAADQGLAVQLHLEPRYAPHFDRLIEEFRTTTVVIDHLGRPFQGTPEEHATIVRWSRFPNTVMKLSAIPPQRMYPHRDIAPIIRQLTDAYGPDRMIYGGGFGATATGKSYANAFEQARAYLAHLSSDDQNKILGVTAARLFQFAT